MSAPPPLDHDRHAVFLDFDGTLAPLQDVINDEGDIVVPAATRLRAQELAAIASSGIDQATVFKKLKVAVISTGNELLPPGAPFEAGCVYDANSPMLGALLAPLPLDVTRLAALEDTRSSVMGALEKAAGSHDVIISTGGAYLWEVGKVAFAVVRRPDVARRYPEIARFMAIPGVGLIGACRFSGYIQTPVRFSTTRKLWRYCRLGITDRTSDGRPLGARRLDRSGHGRLKDMTRKSFAGALRTRADNVFKRTYRQSLARTHNPVHARLNAQRKLLAILRAVWRDDTSYREVVTG